MKTISAGTKAILDKALELEQGSELYVTFNSRLEMDGHYGDLKRQRLWLIENEHLAKYESVLIDRGQREELHAVILTKMSFMSVCIKKADGSKEKVSF